MQLTSIIATALTFISAIQALPVHPRGINAYHGVTYTGKHADGSCESATEVMANVKLMKASGIRNIRTYAQECDVLPNVIKSIHSVGGGMHVLAAVWIDGSANDEAEIHRLQNVLNSGLNLSPVNGIIVGNEVLFKKVMSSSQLVSKLHAVKKIARGIPVGSTEIDGTYTSDLMDASDFAGVNIHPFFSNVNARDAFKNLKVRFDNFRKTAGGKPVLITETGWPSAGAPLGLSVPSVANEKIFADAVARSNLPYYYFEWQDAHWKGDNTESSFGLMNGANKAKF